MGLDRMAMDLAEPRRGDRPAVAAILLSLFPPPDLVARLLPAPGGRRDDLLDAEHRELVPLGLRGLPDRTASPGYLRGVPSRQGPVSVRRRVLEHHPGTAGPRGARNPPGDGHVGVRHRMARHRRMHPDHLGPILGHRDCGVQPAAEPTRGVAGGEPDLHAPRDPVAAILSAIPTPSGVARTRSATSGNLRRPSGPGRPRAGTGHQRQSRAGRGLAHPIDGRGPRPRVVALSVARTLRPPILIPRWWLAKSANLTPDRVRIVEHVMTSSEVETPRTQSQSRPHCTSQCRLDRT